MNMMCSVFTWTAWILSVHLKPWLGRNTPSVAITVSETFGWSDWWCNWGDEDVRKHPTKGRRAVSERRPPHPPTPSLFVWEAAQNVDGVVLCTCEMASKRWKVNNFWWHLHSLQYANEQSCKSQIARREKRRWREQKEGREQRVEKRETDGGWCKLWMQPAISKRKRKAERNLKSCISDYAFATFSYHGPWANAYTIWPLRALFEKEEKGEHSHIRPRRVVWSCVVPSSVPWTWYDVCV